MTVPLIADIHFDHRLALKAAEIVDCVRINPGNIGAWWKVEEVIKAVNARGIPLRVGVNGGSLERPLLDKYGWPSPEALSESALNAVHALEDVGFDMKVSLKASDVHRTIDAYWLFAHQSNYPAYRHYRGRHRHDRRRKVGDGARIPAVTGHRRRSAFRSRPTRSKRSRSVSRFSSRLNCAIAASMCRLSDLRPGRNRRGAHGQ
jgi:hypothetical protein